VLAEVAGVVMGLLLALVQQTFQVLLAVAVVVVVFLLGLFL
jgi:hypothetical protein